MSLFSSDSAALIELFQTGEYEVLGRMPYSSNTTILVNVRAAAPDPDATTGELIEHRAIYKPAKGERPLWDFPDGLFKREAAMYRLAHQIGWNVIPPTTVAVGPFGEGSVQAFVDAEFEHHYFTLFEEGIALKDLRRICVLDLLANNTDRKSGHCLLGKDGHVYGIDNGLAFHAEWKLRTVMWDFVGEPIDDDIMSDVAAFVSQGVGPSLGVLLDRLEIDALETRAKALVNDPVFPEDETGGRRWPWPLV